MFKNMTRSWIRQALIEKEERLLNRRIDALSGPRRDILGQRVFHPYGVLEEVMYKSLDFASVEIVREEIQEGIQEETDDNV